MQKNLKKKKENVAIPKPEDFRIEVDKIHTGLAVLVHGVSSIKDFSPECAIFRTGISQVRVRGEELSITVYEGRAVEVTGKVLGVEFL